jgi:hypothetical protein
VKRKYPGFYQTDPGLTQVVTGLTQVDSGFNQISPLIFSFMKFSQETLKDRIIASEMDLI